MTFATIGLVAALLGGAIGCGNALAPAPGASAGCADGTAILTVGDGTLMRVCGCQEADGTVALPENAITCTVAAGTTVVFLYRGTSIPMQILSVGTPEFQSSAPSLPTSTVQLKAHPVTFDAVGTYEFEDRFTPNLTGQIVVL
ncbi:MAG: hypothetical protein IT285_03555 [Bdellovibrionales bacterium]|nr:hypothetical protein [Bdellovibrionales bacterium]